MTDRTTTDPTTDPTTTDRAVIDRGLPATVYLLAYDVRRGSARHRVWLDYLVRGAALTELLVAGRIATCGDTVEPRGIGVPTDPVLRVALDDVDADQPRTWRALLHHCKPTYVATKDQLTHQGLIEPTWRRHFASRAQSLVEQLQTSTRALLTDDDIDPWSLDVLDAAVVPLAAVIPLRTIAPRLVWHDRAERVASLTAHVARTASGFDELVAQMRRTRGLSATAGGPVH